MWAAGGFTPYNPQCRGQLIARINPLHRPLSSFTPVAERNAIWKLCCRQVCRRDVANEAGERGELPGRFPVQDDHANRLLNLIPNDANWFIQVCVLRQNYGGIEEILPGVMDQIRRQVHIRAPLLRVPDLNVGWAAWSRADLRPHLGLGQEVPLADRDTRDCSQGLQVTLLPPELTLQAAFGLTTPFGPATGDTSISDRVGFRVIRE